MSIEMTTSDILTSERARKVHCTYSQVAGRQLTYRNWIEAIRNGRTVVSRNGHREFLSLTVNGSATPGDEIQLAAAASLPVTLQCTATANLSGTIDLVSNGVVVGSQAAQSQPDDSDSAPAGDYELIRVNLGALYKGQFDQNQRLEPGDIINIPRADVFFVAGEVQAPGSFPLKKEGTTLRQGHLARSGNDLQSQIFSRGHLPRRTATRIPTRDQSRHRRRHER